MKQKWITLALMVCLTAGTALAGADGHWLHVRVDEGDDDGEKINVNIPLSVVMAILPAIESDDFRGGRINIGRGEIEAIFFLLSVSSFAGFTSRSSRRT